MRITLVIMCTHEQTNSNRNRLRCQRCQALDICINTDKSALMTNEKETVFHEISCTEECEYNKLSLIQGFHRLWKTGKSGNLIGQGKSGGLIGHGK